MSREKSRKYVSPVREQQAAATRNRILDVAESLFVEKGFLGTTIAAVAAAAGVSQQCVYSIFTSKAGIISAGIEERMLRDERNIDAIMQLKKSDDPIIILQGVAKLLSYIYATNEPTFRAMFGAGIVSPQLAELEKELASIRWAKEEATAQALFNSGKLLSHLDLDAVRDILWALTSREVYALFVFMRGWPVERYEEQLYSMLVGSLVHPDTIDAHRRAGTLFLRK
jgi:Transcriptional regulator